MSAYIVDPTHIDVMLSVAINGPEGSGSTWHGPYVNELLEEEGLTGPVRVEVADKVGRDLLRENITSVSHLSGHAPRRLPGPNPNPIPELYEWTDLGKVLTPIEGCRAIDCYRGQSSEHPGWWRSGARSFCERLTLLLVRQMRGYSEAVGEWTIERVVERFFPEDL